jgi:hypothetical protein
MNVHNQPVGHHYQSFHVVFQKHFQIALETIPLVVRVGKNRHVGRLIKRILNAAQNRRTERIGDVKNTSPTLWLRLLRRNRAIAFGRYPSFLAASSIRFLVAGAM